MADPASVIGTAPSYGNAVVSLSGGVTPAQLGGTPANVDQRNWLGQPIRTGGIEFVDGKGYRRRKGTDANGNVIYQDLTSGERQANGGQYSWDREDAELNRRRTAAAQAEAREIDQRTREENNQRYSQELDLRTKGLEGQLEQIRQQGATANAQIALTREQMQQTSADRALDRSQQGNQFNANIALQTEQIRANNDLLKQRMGLEDRHFQQKMEYDNKMSRRAQIISSLSLVAQSLARL